MLGLKVFCVASKLGSHGKCPIFVAVWTIKVHCNSTTAPFLWPKRRKMGTIVSILM